ncbi:hypothetical protein PN498_13040 [Oscillatoria sp. CS-180]|uniref:hypothetical protein n=1 Tax=Oscillatoria sp. CS-180 TaxID=3021720 RepID=UPI00232BCA10|nr:hypothetical protein [Oscillatoria sp. CS-180]MDB9526918.1 hypothetical protein [Oscillatoria sp. CS-180]
MADNSTAKKPTGDLEQGNIYFVYLPKVQSETVNALDDVQQLHIILEPHNHQWFRLITIGKKTLPDPKSSGRQGWCYVDSVTDSNTEFEEGMRRRTYQTKTLGERLQPAARPVGEGVYRLLTYDDQTRLVYALELPKELGEAQKLFNIGKTGDYIVSVKNPDQNSSDGQGFQKDSRKADFPESLQERFGDRRFASLSSVDFLDYEGAELLLIGTDADSPEAIGTSLSPQDEDESSAEIINKLRMRKTRHPLGPLLEGTLE